ARRDAGPRPLVRAGECRDLEDALPPDDDLGQGERVVGEGREQLRVEPACAVVALPALAGDDDLVLAGRRQRRDQAVDVAPVLGDRVADPQTLDPAQLGGIEAATEHGLDGRPVRHRATIPRAGQSTNGGARTYRTRRGASRSLSMTIKPPWPSSAIPAANPSWSG